MAKKASRKPKAKTKKSPGPAAERLKLDGPWKDRVAESFKAKPAKKKGTK